MNVSKKQVDAQELKDAFLNVLTDECLIHLDKDGESGNGEKWEAGFLRGITHVKDNIVNQVIDRMASVEKSALPTEEEVEEYLKSLQWKGEADDYQITLVHGNIRGFYGWLSKRVSK